MKKVFNNAFSGERVALALVAILSFLTIQAFGYIVNIRPIVSDIERFKAQQETQQQMLMAEHQVLRDLSVKKLTFENTLIQPQLQADLMLFSGRRLMLTDIAEQGRLHGLQFAKLELDAEENLENYQRSVVHFELQGDYQSMINFVISISDKYASFVFEKVILKRSGLKSKPLSMSVMSYLYHPKMNKNIDD